MTSVSGPSLTFESVTRAQAASYLCIASNGVPPSVSKRVDLRVQCRSAPRQAAALTRLRVCSSPRGGQRRHWGAESAAGRQCHLEM